MEIIFYIIRFFLFNILYIIFNLARRDSLVYKNFESYNVTMIVYILWYSIFYSSNLNDCSAIL